MLIAIMDKIITKKITRYYSDRDQFRMNKIRFILRTINKHKIFRKQEIKPRDIERFILDYSMCSSNYNTGMRNISKMMKLTDSPEVKEVAEQAKIMLKERLLEDIKTCS